MMVFGFAWVQMYYGVLAVVLYMIVWLFVLVLIFASFQMAIRKALQLRKNASEKMRRLVPLFGAMLPTAVVVFFARRYSDRLTLFVLNRVLHR